MPVVILRTSRVGLQYLRQNSTFMELKKNNYKHLIDKFVILKEMLIYFHQKQTKQQKKT